MTSTPVEENEKARQMPFRPDRPYNQLPSLPPRSDVETRRVLKATIEARAALAELRSSGLLIPNQDILVGSIPLLEAQASGQSQRSTASAIITIMIAMTVMIMMDYRRAAAPPACAR
jgi:hypothetical protein